MRVLLADDQEKVCSALRLLLGQKLGMDVVGEVAGAQGLLAEIKRSRPDLLLLDWELPGLSANGHFSTLRARYPHLKVIALSGRPDTRRAALDAGADAFVCKGDPPERLLGALHRVLKVKQKGEPDV
jgi:DNA-binding NarL/FixJ family response regulator